jgi:hypothetical protein
MIYTAGKLAAAVADPLSDFAANSSFKLDWKAVPGMVSLFQMLLSVSLDDRSKVREKSRVALGNLLCGSM